ncbi:hypothetical protein E3O42_02210 [Cryobacterium adonitolivorans]|uniref:Uncharacterized protein n=1 Tax=Cryobacterium adonitolivorans TaxID=1259189 RepID=A0A4R8WEF5_9MICO|nr:hypothetical protein [Cryobacterium adonitolivorans]TFC05804.1 hypothetical protein E3O42_02210 [Cryobacterium adonitolivorans]
MAHPYPLYVNVLAQCFCCQSLQPFHFTSATDQVVCGHCLRHLGHEKAEQRDADHIRLWLGQFAAQQETLQERDATIAERDAEIAALAAQVADLTGIVAGRFDRGPDAGLRGLLETEVLKRAERKAELGQRRTDVAMAVLWQIDQLHRVTPADPQRCGCGKSAAACPETRALGSIRQALGDWESKNRKLLAAGQRHALPAGHPDLV